MISPHTSADTLIYLPSDKCIDLRDSVSGLRVADEMYVNKESLVDLMAIKDFLNIDGSNLDLDGSIEVTSLILKAIDNTTTSLTKASLDSINTTLNRIVYSMIPNTLTIGDASLATTTFPSDVLTLKNFRCNQSVAASFFQSLFTGNGTFTSTNFTGTGSYTLQNIPFVQGSIESLLVKMVNFKGTWVITYGRALSSPPIINWGGNVDFSYFTYTTTTISFNSGATVVTGCIAAIGS